MEGVITSIEELSIEFDQLPPSPNRTRESTHWAARSNLVARWRGWAKLLTLDEINRWPASIRAGLPWTAYRLSVTFYLPDKRRRDPGNLVGSEAIKAAIDGLVDAGLVSDDSVDELLVYGPFAFELRRGKPGCRVTVNPLTF